MREWNQDEYETWEARVSRSLEARTGCALWDLPDIVDTAALYEAGETVANAVAYIIRVHEMEIGN